MSSVIGSGIAQLSDTMHIENDNQLIPWGMVTPIYVID